jgi:hypothetical protein
MARILSIPLLNTPSGSRPSHTLHRGTNCSSGRLRCPPFLIAHRDPSQVSTDDPRRALVPSAEHPAIPPCEWSIHELTPRCWRPSPLFRGPETWAPASRIGHIPLSAPNPSALGFLLLNGFTRTAGLSCECHLHHRCFLSASIILHVDPFFASSNLPLSAIAKCIRCDNIFSLGR